MELVFSKSTETVFDSFNSMDPLWLLFRLETVSCWEKDESDYYVKDYLNSYKLKKEISEKIAANINKSFTLPIELPKGDFLMLKLSMTL